MLYYNGSDISEGNDTAKSSKAKSVWFATICFLIMGLNFQIMFVMFFCWLI